jgi:hypothetical protein
MNVRAFVEPPRYELREGKHIVITTMYHWNGHPKYGYSTDEQEFLTERDARLYLFNLGYVPH